MLLLRLTFLSSSEVALEEQTVPKAVFGGISEEKATEVLGAKARFAQKKQN